MPRRWPGEWRSLTAQELKQLKSVLPEHCYGTDGYINVHSASPEHIQKLEDMEEEIEKLEADLGQ